MQHNLWRALLLAVAILLIGAIPVMAQSDDEGLSLATDDGNVLVGLQNDIVVPVGQSADLLFVVDGTARVEGSAEVIVAFDSEVDEG